MPLEPLPSTTENHRLAARGGGTGAAEGGASPMYLPLVPAFNQCTVPNATRNAVRRPSNLPPRETSGDLTVGARRQRQGGELRRLRHDHGAGIGRRADRRLVWTCGVHTRSPAAAPGVHCPTTPETCISTMSSGSPADRSNPAGTAGTMEDVLGINSTGRARRPRRSDDRVSCPAVTTLNASSPRLIVCPAGGPVWLRSLALKDTNNEFAVPGTFYP